MTRLTIDAVLGTEACGLPQLHDKNAQPSEEPHLRIVPVTVDLEDEVADRPLSRPIPDYDAEKMTRRAGDVYEGRSTFYIGVQPGSGEDGPTFRESVRRNTGIGAVLDYMLAHIGELVSNDTLRDVGVSGNWDPHTITPNVLYHHMKRLWQKFENSTTHEIDKIVRNMRISGYILNLRTLADAELTGEGQVPLTLVNIGGDVYSDSDYYYAGVDTHEGTYNGRLSKNTPGAMILGEMIMSPGDYFAMEHLRDVAFVGQEMGHVIGQLIVSMHELQGFIAQSDTFQLHEDSFRANGTSLVSGYVLERV